jgi:hypothetical protein
MVYRTTPPLTTAELTFYLTYGTEAIIHVEIGGLGTDIQTNDENSREDFDFVEEIRN